jgi:hypothetical protein
MLGTRGQMGLLGGSRSVGVAPRPVWLTRSWDRVRCGGGGVVDLPGRRMDIGYFFMKSKAYLIAFDLMHLAAPYARARRERRGARMP